MSEVARSFAGCDVFRPGHEPTEAVMAVADRVLALVSCFRSPTRIAARLASLAASHTVVSM